MYYVYGCLVTFVNVKLCILPMTALTVESLYFWFSKFFQFLRYFSTFTFLFIRRIWVDSYVLSFFFLIPFLSAELNRRSDDWCASMSKKRFEPSACCFIVFYVDIIVHEDKFVKLFVFIVDFSLFMCYSTFRKWGEKYWHRANVLGWFAKNWN